MCDRVDTSVSDTLQWLILSPISSWSLGVMCAAICYHFITILCKATKVQTVIYNRDSTLSRHIIKNISWTCDNYMVPVWASSPFLQTLLTPFLLGKPFCNFKRDYLLLNDRGIVAMDWYNPQKSSGKSKPDRLNYCNGFKKSRTLTVRKSKLILIVVPDMNENCFSMSYVSAEAVKRDFSVVVFNRRGNGGSALTTPKLQSYGDTSDLRQLVKYVRDRYPRQGIISMGFGSGADLLLSYLGDYGSSSFFLASVAISPLYDPQTNLCDSDQHLSILNKPLHLLHLLREKWLLYKHSSSIPQNVDIYETLKSANFKELFQNSYYKLNENRDPEQFWERNNPLRDVDDISAPLLCISSLDDPFCSPDTIPYDIFSIYPNMSLVTTEIGGHCGYVESSEETGEWKSWAVSLAMDYIQSVITFTSR